MVHRKGWGRVKVVEWSGWGGGVGVEVVHRRGWGGGVRWRAEVEG